MPVRFETQLPIRRRDLDVLGHVNQATYHELLEEVRAGLFLAAQPPQPIEHFVLAHVDLEHRHEVRLEDRYVVGQGSVLAVGRSSVRIDNRLLLPDGRVAVEGSAVLVAWDSQRRGSRLITPEERAALAG